MSTEFSYPGASGALGENTFSGMVGAAGGVWGEEGTDGR